MESAGMAGIPPGCCSRQDAGSTAKDYARSQYKLLDVYWGISDQLMTLEAMQKKPVSIS